MLYSTDKIYQLNSILGNMREIDYSCSKEILFFLSDSYVGPMYFIGNRYRQF